MIRLTDFSLSFPSRTLLSGIDALLGPASLTALIGRNGSGKSTLLRTIAGIRRDYGGTVSVAGSDISSLSASRLATLLTFVSTDRPRIPAMRCRDIVAMGRAPYTNWFGRLSADDRRKIDSALDTVGMTGYADRTADTMSDGECQRLMIARALAQDTPVMLLDEPTSFLDLPARHQLCTLLADLARRLGKCILFSTHELDLAMTFCDRIALIDNPQLIVQTPAGLQAAGTLDRLFGR